MGAENTKPGFTPNKGQWNENVLFRREIPNGYMYLENTGFTYHFMDFRAMDAIHHRKNAEPLPDNFQQHVVRMNFKGASSTAKISTRGESTFYENFFVGKEENWAGGVKNVEQINYEDIYPGIDLHIRVRKNHIKYDLLIAPNTDPSTIQLDYRGADKQFIKDGRLYTETSINQISESAPFAFQMVDGKVVPVPCNYVLNDGIVSFGFPQGYDENLPLTIDPEISFSSYIGSISSNFGFTATYDEEGNLYAGAIVFGNQYPVTTGAFEGSFQGGTIDCGITKFSSDGTLLLYSTYLGGSLNESPHSMVVNEDGELYIFGTTGSFDFATTPGAFQTDFEGGPSMVGGNLSYGFAHNEGVDAFVSKFSNDGTQLLGSTLVGGYGNEGLNIAPSLHYNYGDAFRGEIILDQNSNVYFATTTQQTDFGTSSGAFQTVYGGGESDGFVVKLNSNLTNMIWSAYLGGSEADAAYSICLLEDNSVYVAGGTDGGGFPSANNALHGSYLGGTDGFIVHINPNGTGISGSTFIGTSSYDQCYFVQLDEGGNVYTFGQTEGNYPISDNIYANPNSGQFIQKLSGDLSSSLFYTTVGTGSGEVDISPSAFLVSNCNQIYIAGWGGSVNQLESAIFSTTFGLPVSPDAFQSTTDGNDFYLMVLSPDAEELIYATFFGGSLSAEHVDGGTSRFDKNGNVYQAVCAGCGGNNDFPTQPGVWSETNDATGSGGLCNLGVFKFNLSSVQAEAGIEGPTEVCSGAEIQFLNESIGANFFVWDFGDGNTSTETEPQHSYNTPGSYTVQLYAADGSDCLTADSVTINIEVVSDVELQVEVPDAICQGQSVQLMASGADTYLWSPPLGLSAVNIANPVAAPLSTQTYEVTGFGLCGEDVMEVTVTVFNDQLEISPDTTICPGEEVVLSVFGGETYSWSPGDGLSSTSGSSVTASPDVSTIYTVSTVTSNDCELQGEVQITVLGGPPELEIIDSVSICLGNSKMLIADGADDYVWANVPGLNHYNIANPIASPTQSTTYTVTGYNGCGSDVASVFVEVRSVQANIHVDSSACQNEWFNVSATGGNTYSWAPYQYFENPNAPGTVAHLPQTMEIMVTAYDEHFCQGRDSAIVTIYPSPYISAGNDVLIDYGGAAQLHAYSPYPVEWEMDPTLSCIACMDPVATPWETTMYYATVISPEGCITYDSAEVRVIGSLYIPNAFTPNGDGMNDIFKAKGIDIEEFQIMIYDRWGNEMFQGNHISEGWNGSVRNGDHYAPAGVYNWILKAKKREQPPFEWKGHVTLIR